jgi:hypothetical protein
LKPMVWPPLKFQFHALIEDFESDLSGHRDRKRFEISSWVDSVSMKFEISGVMFLGCTLFWRAIRSGSGADGPETAFESISDGTVTAPSSSEAQILCAEDGELQRECRSDWLWEIDGELRCFRVRGFGMNGSEKIGGRIGLEREGRNWLKKIMENEQYLNGGLEIKGWNLARWQCVFIENQITILNIGLKSIQ